MSKRLAAHELYPSQAMKLKISLTCLALLFGCIAVQAQKSEDQLLLHSLGSSAGQALYSTHMAVNILSDAWAAKAYEDAMALRLAGSYEGGINAMAGSLKELLENSKSLTDSDQQFLSGALEACQLISAQVSAFKGYVKTGDKTKAKIFETKRKEAQAKVFGLLGIDDDKSSEASSSASPRKLRFEIVKSTMPGGGPGFLGQVEFERPEEGKAFTATWKYAKGGGDKGIGVPFPASGAIAVGFGPDVLGVAIYKLDGNKVYAKWAGYEAGAPIGEYEMAEGEGKGLYNIKEGGSVQFDFGKSRTAKVRWKLATGEYNGIAVAEGDYLAAISLKPGGKGGVAIYTANVEEKTATGRWIMTGAEGVGEEEYKLLSAESASVRPQRTEDQVRAIAEMLRTQGAGALAKLKPNARHVSAIAATSADAQKLQAYAETVYAKLEGSQPLAKEGQTEIRVIGDAALPGGYHQYAAHFKSPDDIYGFEFVKPGDEFGMSYDGLVQVQDQWVMIPKMWRAFSK